ETDTGPYIVTSVELPAGDDANYSLGFLLAGEYTLALLCNSVDDPELPDEPNFLESYTTNVLVTEEQTTIQNF
ncbi:MAG: DUF4382 domain-containing protein, partial [Saccharospirillaceae bacterium]|nr:hypothetical protein [Pseudomonadales bacterium]NRB81122.1 DUF4382 domain-containing protein [Saccharospirillaceae bacterium]